VDTYGQRLYENKVLNSKPHTEETKKQEKELQDKGKKKSKLHSSPSMLQILNRSPSRSPTGEADQYDFQGDVFKKNTTSKPPVTTPPKSRSKVCTWKIKDLARSLPTNASKEVNDI
jgi:hypothetical protein